MQCWTVLRQRKRYATQKMIFVFVFKLFGQVFFEPEESTAVEKVLREYGEKIRDMVNLKAHSK